MMHYHDPVDEKAGAIQESRMDILSQYNFLQSSGALDDLENLRRENRELDNLITDAATLISLDSLSRMLDFIIGRVLEHFIPQFLAFIIEPPRGNRITQYSFRNLKPSEETIPPFLYKRLKECFAGKSFAMSFEALKAEFGDFSELEPFNPEMIFPLLGIDGVYGMVVLGRKVLGVDYTDLERMYIDRLIRFLAIGIQNGLHHHSSITDAKTGLYNHDFFMRRLEEELARSDRHGNRSCVLMIDVDHFKHFNDTYGHLAGDVALESLAASLKQSMRTGDAVARFGGEEFCVLAVDCDETGAHELAERIRVAVEGMMIPHGAEKLSITVSIGMRMIDPRNSAKRVLDEADKALYASKAGGRNRCTMFKPGLLGRASMLRDVRIAQTKDRQL